MSRSSRLLTVNESRNVRRPMLCGLKVNQPEVFLRPSLDFSFYSGIRNIRRCSTSDSLSAVGSLLGCTAEKELIVSG